MSERIWPTIRLRLGEILTWFAAAAAMAIVAGILAWNPDSDFSLTANFPESISRTQSSMVVARLAPDESDEAQASGAVWTLYRTNADDEVEAVADGNIVELKSGTADSKGLFTFELPTYDSSLEPAEDGDIGFVLEAKHDGETFYRFIEYAAPPVASFIITLDRPLYQPGQTVDMRVLALSPDTGEPRSVDLQWSIYDPQGNLIKQTDATTSKLGIASTSIALAPNGLQGEYRAEVKVGEEMATSATFEVRPFRLPRFTVDVEFDASQVNAGEFVKGRAVARYTYGEPVADETVTVVISPDGQPATTVSGKTDGSGAFNFEWKSPRYMWGTVNASATVQTEAGRMEKGVASAIVKGDSLAENFEIELIPSRRRAFVSDHDNIGYLRVTRGGEPVSNVEVKLYLPEKETEKEVTLTTDTDGLARFEWRPVGNSNVSAILFAPGGEERQELSVRQQWNMPALSPRSVRLEVGQEAEVDVHSTFLHDDRSALVALYDDGAIVAVGPVEQDGVGRLEIPSGATGLYWVGLLYFEDDGGLQQVTNENVPIWVAQPGGSEVTLSFDQQEYRPGEAGQLELAFPAKVEGQTPAEVAFGLVAVDEALYALADRPTQALHLAVREDPSTIATMESALPMLEAAAEGSEATQNIAMTRYLRQLESISPQSSYERSRDITESVEKHKGYIGAAIWVVFCLALILLFSGLAARATLQSLREKKSFTWKRMFAQVGLLFAAWAVAFAFMIGGEEGFVGGAAMWALVSFGWLLGAGWRTRGETKLMTWTLLTLGGVWVWGCGLLGGFEVFNAYGDFGDTYIMVGAAIPGVLWLIEAGLWSFVMLREREWQAALSLTSFFAVVLAGPFFMMTAGAGSQMEKMSMAPRLEESAAGNRFVDMEAEPEIMPGSPARAKQKAMDPGGAAPADSAGPSGPRVRAWFPETMIWVAETIADESGIARLPLEFPDSITTWRFDAWANTSDGRLGSGQAKVRTIQKFFAEVELPTHLTTDDVIEVPVTLANRGDEPVMARLSAEADGALTLRRRLPTQVVVAPNQRALFTMSVVADGVGPGGLTVTAAADAEGGGDAVRRQVTVEPDGAIITNTEAGIVADGFRTTVTVPLSALPGTSSVEVGLYPSVMADALAGLESMLRQPAGCFEQTSSANYPNVLILKTMRANDPESWPTGADAWREAEEAATQFVELGYQRMISFQKSGGGFMLYPDSDEADPMLTGYGLMQLAEMRDVTFVDEEVAGRAVRWLETIQDQNGSWPAWAGRVSGGSWRSDSDPGQVRATSFIVMGVIPWKDGLRDPRTVERALDRIEERLPSAKSVDALAYAANALLMGGREEAARGVLKRLDGMATRKEGQVWWSGSGQSWMGASGGYADVEATAVTGWAVVELGENPQLSRSLLQFLAQARRGGGGWGSTQATVWALRLFEKLRKLDDGEVDVTIRIDDDPMERSSGEGADGVARVGGDRPQLLHQFTGPIATGASELAIMPPNGSTTTAMVQATTRYAVPWDSREAAATSGTLVLDWRVTSRDFVVGKPVEVVATLENPTNDWIANAIVELPMPPGAFVDLDQVRERFDASNVELLPTHIRAYIDELPPGSRTVFPYQFVPMVRGRVSVPPMRAYPFYAPTPRSEIDAGDCRTE